MPIIMEYNLSVSEEKYARLATAFGIERGTRSDAELAQAAVDYVRELNHDLGIASLGELIRREDLDLLAEKAAANTSRPSNPRDVDKAEFRAMLEEALA